jgi:hypothetical protein
LKESCGVGKGEVFFNEEALHIQKKVYITEGWSCAATIGAAGVSQQGSIPGVIQRNILLTSEAEEIILVPDGGFYMQGLLAAKSLLGHKKIKVVNLDWFQTQGIGKDVNEVGKENLLAQEEKTPWMDIKFLFHQLNVYKK